MVWSSRHPKLVGSLIAYSRQLARLLARTGQLLRSIIVRSTTSRPWKWHTGHQLCLWRFQPHVGKELEESHWKAPESYCPRSSRRSSTGASYFSQQDHYRLIASWSQIVPLASFWEAPLWIWRVQRRRLRPRSRQNLAISERSSTIGCI